MTKEEYLALKNECAVKTKKLNAILTKAKIDYIELNSPCKKGDLINIILGSGRKAKGIANDFFIWKDGNVYLSSYKDFNDSEKIKYISVPTQSIEIIKINNK